MSPEVTFARVPPRRTAAVAQVTTWRDFPGVWRQMLDEVYRFVRDRPELATGAGSEAWQNVMLYRDDTPSVEVGVLVSASFQPVGSVLASELPGGEVATATHRGDYGRLHLTHDAVRHQLTARGREPAGPRWEIYGHWRADPDELETGVFWLLR